MRCAEHERKAPQGGFAEGGMAKALAKLVEEVSAGVLHGFFSCTVSCAMKGGKKRHLTISAGKTYTFWIMPEELDKTPPVIGGP